MALLHLQLKVHANPGLLSQGLSSNSQQVLVYIQELKPGRQLL
jgi:hypothetical protein